MLKHSQTHGLEIMSNLTRICSCGYLSHCKGLMFSLGCYTLLGVGKLFCWSYIPDQLNRIFPVGFVRNIHQMNSYFIYNTYMLLSTETKKSTTCRRKKMNFIILMQTQQEHNILLTVLPLSWDRGFTSELYINDTSFFNSFLLSASNS